MSPAASTGDWKGPFGVADGVIGGGASVAGAAPDRRVRAPRRAVFPASGSTGASAGVIFLCFLLAILLAQRRALC